MIIGGHAVILYSEPRFTRDIDITLGVGSSAAKEIAGLAKSMGLTVLVKNIQSFADKTMVLPVINNKSGIRVDFIFSNSAYEKQALKRVTVKKMDMVKIKYASAEDIIIHKVIAGRPRDIEDIEGILKHYKNLDNKYIRKHLKEFDEGLSADYLKQYEKIRDTN